MVDLGVVSDLWRFPVKSFGGERIRRALVEAHGLAGDRRHAVLDVATGGAMTARRTSALLGYAARSTDAESGEGVVVTTPEGRELTPQDPELSRDVSARVGGHAAMARSPAAVHDCAPIHLVSEASLAAAAGWLGADEIDRCRFRANVVVETGHGGTFPEGEWVGGRVAIGDELEIEVLTPTERCAVTTFDPETLERDTRVLAAIARERENLFGVYAAVVTPGRIAVGDRVRLRAGA